LAERPKSGLDELISGPVAVAVLRSLMRDQERQMRVNGVGVQQWTLPVYRALQDAAGRQLPVSARVAYIGPPVGKLSSSSWLGVMDAAARTGMSERHIRRLASSGRVVARRVGRRNWVVDIDSLENVLRNQAA
jgi:hypothetical protein